jgi:hypothetical protein
MKKRNRFGFIAVGVACAGLAAGTSAQQPPAQPGSAPDRVAALKASIQDGLGKARQYEWIETTTISLKGEQKAQKQNRCYYGADGKIVKVPIDQPPASSAEPAGGGRGNRRGGGKLKQQIVENKKDDLKEYMERAAALIHQYVPPVPAKVQAAKDAGHIKVNPQTGAGVQLAISQYLQPGDSLTLDVDPATNRLVGLGVNTYLDKPEDAVTLAVQMNTLSDGALYAAQTTLDAKAKNINVVIRNSGHRLR